MMQGKTDDGEIYFLEELAIAQEIGHQEITCGLLNNLGMAAVSKGHFEQSMDYWP